MAHPIVIMAYDKSPAITKAVAALEEAGLEVIVLNTATAKLVNFLGALAGEAEEDETPVEAADDLPAEDEPEVKPAAKKEPALRPEEMPDEDLPEEEPLATEAMINGEKVSVEIVDGKDLVLHADSITTGAKTSYKLNESNYSFWPMATADEPIAGGVALELDGTRHFANVIFSEEVKSPPVLQLGREWLKEAGYPHNSWSVLPATGAIYNKGKVTPDEVDRELGRGRGIMVVKNGKDKLIMLPGGNETAGLVHKAHHDQSFRTYGDFTVLGQLTKDGDVWKFDGLKTPGLETPEQIAKFKAPVFVFK